MATIKSDGYLKVWIDPGKPSRRCLGVSGNVYSAGYAYWDVDTLAECDDITNRLTVWRLELADVAGWYR